MGSDNSAEIKRLQENNDRLLANFKEAEAKREKEQKERFDEMKKAQEKKEKEDQDSTNDGRT